MWMDYEIVQKKLQTNGINIDFFRDKFASKVFDFTISVIKSKNEIGECPIIGVMLILFKKKNIPLNDVFMICVHLKNAVFHFLHTNSILDDETINEVSILMDYNFEGVIKEYVQLYYNDTSISNTPSIKHEKVNIIVEQENTTTSAKVYIQEVNIDTELIEELDDLEEDTLNAIDQDEFINQKSIIESANLFEQYAKVLNMMYEFEELAYTLTILKDLLNSTDFETLDDTTKNMISTYLSAIISDLRSWRISIFSSQNAEDIHYLDKTLLSSIAQLQITLMPQENNSNDEIEFF
jgi:hypothetical protein